MRARLAALSLAGLLILAVAAPAAAGPNVYNLSGSGITLQADWYDDDTYGWVAFFDESYGFYADFGEMSGSWTTCDNGTKKKTSDDYEGFIGTYIYGYGWDGTLSMDAKFTTGTGTAAVEYVVVTVNDCTRTWSEAPGTATISIALTGTGPIATFRSKSSFKVPSEFNWHSSYSGKQRAATGSVDLGALGTRTPSWAFMASYTWRDHANG
jgi:hypothetical protein